MQERWQQQEVLAGIIGGCKQLQNVWPKEKTIVSENAMAAAALPEAGGCPIFAFWRRKLAEPFARPIFREKRLEVHVILLAWLSVGEMETVGTSITQVSCPAIFVC